VVLLIKIGLVENFLLGIREPKYVLNVEETKDRKWPSWGPIENNFVTCTV